MPQNSFKARLKGGLNKWRLSFLIFALVYGAILVFGFSGIHELSYMSIQWDEVTHFNGGVLLLRGDFNTYFNFNAFYPPMYDLVTAGFFSVAGISVFTGRLVSVVFSLLSLYAVFEFTYRNYGPKTALLASALLGLMPGYFWLSRMAMIETMLVFFFTISTVFFFTWLRSHQNKFLVLSGLTLGLGILTKYQMIIAGAIMITSLFLLARNYLKQKLRRFPLLILAVAAIVIPWILVSYQIYASGMLDQWLYALSIGNPDKSLYSVRFPTPIFYLIEMTVPYSDVHPISFFLYTLGLAGLGLLAWKRKTQDKYLLIWFSIVYIFFTVIANKQWRYALPIFPVIAISAANLITTALNKAKRTLTLKEINNNKKHAVKIAAIALIAFTLVGVAFSVSDAYSWVAKDQIQIPIEAATNYAATRLSENESIMVMCAQNLFSQDMVRFYLIANGKNNKVWQYPELPVDTYTPNFNITEFVNLCKQRNVKYVFTYEFGGTVPYFNTDLNLHEVYMMLYDSGSFSPLADEYSFGTNPRRIFILTFLD